MQTPEPSPDRRKGPLSSLTQKSWRNLRSKMQVLSPSPRDESRGQFVVLSSSLNAPRDARPPDSPPSIVVAASDGNLPGSRAPSSSYSPAEAGLLSPSPPSSPPPLPAPPASAAPRQSKLGESLIPRDEPLNRSGTFLAAAGPYPEEGTNSDCDRLSAFSFSRQMSRKYYKDPEDLAAGDGHTRSPCGSIDSYALSCDSYGSYGSYASYGSYISDDSYVSPSGDEMDVYGMEEDLSHLEEPDYLSALISEANEVPLDEELGADEYSNGDSFGVRRTRSAPSALGASIHRQLSFDSYKSASSLLDELRLKRVKSTMSTTSSVWPIME